MISLVFKQLTRYLPKSAISNFNRPLTTFLVYPFAQHERSSRKNTNDMTEGEARDDKRDRKFASKKYNSKKKDVQLEQILKRYRVIEKNSDEELISQFTGVIKRVTNHYRVQKHNEFLECKQQLQKLIITIPRLNFEAMELIHLLNILDFFRIILRIEGLKTQIVGQAKVVVFEIVTRYLQLINELSLQEIYVMVCKLAPLNYYKYNDLAKKFCQFLETDVHNGQQLPFTTYENYILLKSFSKKGFLNYSQKKILGIFIKDLHSRREELDTQTRIQLIKALIDINIPNNIADHRVLNLCDELINQSAEIAIKEKIGLGGLLHLTQCSINQNEGFRKLMCYMYNRIFEGVSRDGGQNYNFNTLINCLRHYQDNFPAEHKKLAIRRLKDDYLKGNQIIKKRVTEQVLDLLKLRYLSSEGQALNELVRQPSFEFYWTLACEYSMQGLVFPAERMIQKSRHVTYFGSDKNAIKRSLAISIQAKLQPQNQQLQQICAQDIIYIKEAACWSQSNVREWLASLVLYYPADMRAFHKIFGHLYYSKIVPSQQQIEKDYSGQDIKFITNLSFWKYFLGVSDFSSQEDLEMICKISGKVITMIIMQQTNRKNLSIDFKPTLLLALQLKLLSNSIKIHKYSGVIIRLLEQYLPLLSQANDAFLTNYFNVCISLVKSYKKSEWNLTSDLLMKLVNIKNPRIANSINMRRLISQMVILKNGIFTQYNQYEHTKLAICRAALRHNLIKQTMLSHLNEDFLNKFEKNILTAMIGQYEGNSSNSEDLTCLFNNSHTTEKYLLQKQQQILTGIDKCDLRALEQLLIHYQLQRNQVSNRILLYIVKKLMSQLDLTQINFLEIISKHHRTLYHIDKNILKQLLNFISHKLEEDMALIHLLDHQYFLYNCSHYKMIPQSYITKVREHSIKADQLSNSTVQLYFQLARNGLIQNIQWSIIQNYAAFNLNIYVRMLLYYEDSIPDLKNKLQKLIRLQTYEIPRSIFLQYIKFKYQLNFKERQGFHALLLKLNPLTEKFKMGLQNAGVSVKSEQFGLDKVYLIGKKVVLAELETHNVREAQFIEKVLYTLYKREVFLVSSQSNITEVSQLYQLMSPHLDIEEEFQTLMNDQIV